MRGITVTLYERVQSGTDAFNAPVYTETPVQVDNVLVGQPETDDITASIELYGKQIRYMLGIPKGDTHEWTAGKKVNFFGEDWRIVELPEEGIEKLIPLAWNKKVRVERYEQG